MTDVGRGCVRSPDSGELWNFTEGSKLECVEGSYLVTYTWDGRLFKPVDESVCHGAYGVWENNSWAFFVPDEDKNEPFWRATYDPVDCEATITSIQYKSPVTMKHLKPPGENARWQKKDGGGDHPRGHGGDDFEVQGSCPLALAYFAVMFSRTQLILEMLIERRKRRYARCNAFTPKQNCKPLLCVNCARLGALCIVCNAAADGIEGRNCKQCSIKRNFCAKCGDNLGKGEKKEGFLCSACGIGQRGAGCCRMKY